MHSNWTYILWKEEDFSEWMVNKEFFYKHNRGDTRNTHRSDVARLEILHRFGGVYLDVDIECVRPLDSLLDEMDTSEKECFIAKENEEKAYSVLGTPLLCNAVMGCKPRSKLMEHLVHRLPIYASWFPDWVSTVGVSGPWYVTAQQAWRSVDFAILPDFTFYPTYWDTNDRLPWKVVEKRLANSYGWHHWGVRILK